MRAASLAVFLLLTGACSGEEHVTDLCDIARAPNDYIGREVTVQDIIIVDGHGAPQLIPDSSCDELLWFTFKDGRRDERFSELVSQLNITTIDGHRAGLAGNYTVEVIRQRDPGLIELRLVDASGLHIVDAHSKTGAWDKQMGAPPQEGR